MTKNEKDLCITSKQLTELWKKGELPDGTYYVTDKRGIMYIDYFADVWDTVDVDEVEQVLAPVPSYDEWKDLKEYERIVASYFGKPIDYEIACDTVNKLLDEKKNLKEQNAQLKDVLKECKNEFKYLRKHCDSRWKNNPLLEERIDEALK